MADFDSLPSPPSHFLLGNLLSIDTNNFMRSLLGLADEYGALFKLTLPGNKIIIASNQALANELCDEKRFYKGVHQNVVLKQLRNGIADGLFTAATGSPSWGIAHRLLMPAFGPMPMKNMFEEMHDVSTQLALKWARQGPSEAFVAADDFTRLTLDAIALCSMGFRFNSFYHDDLHPFVKAMSSFLTESGKRSRRPFFVPSFFYRSADKQYLEDIELMRQTAQNVLDERKKYPDARTDLLSAMMDGIDKKTGEKISDEDIISNLITFLIAGHETTSGMLAFAFYELLQNPETYAAAQKEVDEVIGTGPIRVDHMGKLPYIAAVLRETLRLCPTIPVVGVTSSRDQLLGGTCHVKEGQPVIMLLGKLHLDRDVYGEDAMEFRPERMLDEPFNRRNKEFPNCWKPFGNGMRGCIGRPFAWQEALLVMAMMLQNFTFVMDDPNYELSIKETLTLKPDGFKMRAKLRHGLTPTTLSHRLSGISSSASSTRPGTPNAAHVAVEKGQPMNIFYGSNTGTCKAMAQQLASDVSDHGFSASVFELDQAVEKLDKGRPNIFITASYEGQPPDNAAKFFAWLQSQKGNAMEGVSFAVFGCGNREWSSTFHRIPRSVDDLFGKLGGSRIAEMGLSDAVNGDMFGDFESWQDKTLWSALEAKYGADLNEGVSPSTSAGFSVAVSSPRASSLGKVVGEATVTATKVLTTASTAKKHIEIALPENQSYAPGDYLAVLPMNPADQIHRVLRRFGLFRDTYITISTDKPTLLPTKGPAAVYDILSSYVELGHVATRRTVQLLAERAVDEKSKAVLDDMASEGYSELVSAKKLSLLDLLERFPQLDFPFGTFLSLLPPMMIRQYSISSSPQWNPHRVTLTYAVLDAEHTADPTRRHVGVASSFLSALTVGDKLRASVKPAHAGFHLPEDAASTPIICVAAGTGIAPFRGFIQERAMLLKQGQRLAPALLFFGCRGPAMDDLYRQELEAWQAVGAVDIRRAYSRAAAGDAQSRNCKYVQDRMLHDSREVAELWMQGAQVFVCGSRAMGRAVGETFTGIVAEHGLDGLSSESSGADKEEWFRGIRNVRFSMDVFD
ncbi:cytochrome P450 [Stachybotrys elegans]|uniref:Bifunctional cytochrome P450/NADPH--P450 reductase n=1 Tax=Stachybotrys elegans TaxID=80388 RepID=A0A8K0SSH8_9HYPO|nr:cytochrome P450 [Stachybotrys elegans]